MKKPQKTFVTSEHKIYHVNKYIKMTSLFVFLTLVYCHGGCCARIR